MKEELLKINIQAKAEAAALFYSLLQNGFYIDSETGISLYDFLFKECGIDEEYITGTIKTVILNNQPVDDYKKAVIRDGNVLSLSGPMPGLVGATMRAGGFYSSLRSSITYRDNDHSGESGRGMVFLKLFNLVMSDLGKKFLEAGIIYGTDELKSFFADMKEDSWNDISSVGIDDQPAGIDELKDGNFGDVSSLALMKVNFV